MSHSIASSDENARDDVFPGDTLLNSDEAEIVSDDDFVNTAIPEKKPLETPKHLKKRKPARRVPRGYVCKWSHKASPAPAPVPVPESEPDTFQTAGQELAQEAQKSAICDEIINAVASHENGSFAYDLLMLLDPFYAQKAVLKACEDAGCSILNMNDQDMEFVTDGVVELMKRMRDVLPNPVKDSILLAGMSYPDMLKKARKIAKRHGKRQVRLKKPANHARTNIRRVLGIRIEDDQVQNVFDDGVIEKRKDRIIYAKLSDSTDDDVIITAQDSFVKSEEMKLHRDKAITDCLRDSCTHVLNLTPLAITCTLLGGFHGDTPIEEAEAELKRLISNMKASLKRKAVRHLVGKYIVEKHEDETPHVHITLYVNDNEIDAVRDTVHHYFPAPDLDVRDNVELIENALSWEAYTDIRSGFIGLRRDIKRVFSSLYIGDDPNVDDLDGFRVHMIHELIRARKQRKSWLFLMNGFAYDDINNMYIHDDVDDVPDVMNEQDVVTDDVDNESTTDITRNMNIMKDIQINIGDDKTSVFRNNRMIAVCKHMYGIIASPEVKIDDAGNVSVEFTFNPDQVQKSSKSISQKGSACNPQETGENEKISHVKQNKDGTRTRAHESNDPDPDDDPDPTPPAPAPKPTSGPSTAPSTAKSAIPRIRTGSTEIGGKQPSKPKSAIPRRPLMQRAPPSDAARAERAARAARAQTGEHAGNQKYLKRRGKPTLFHFDGFLVTRDEIGLLRAAKALNQQE